ncbi:SUKH-4 family immunity protein [Streptomyces pinistramenti]|uniref:SUKH-4 family immunity protein n=1 Tax=Streptomyces pinistramenti TaxID=2884812 RepID=UPI001D05D932|nr:SUKH-4 family immunity protein [Streptomyces pinistramenti]MCB5912028.1 SUKH-4 family immunity protein [Streptomyces pinistramenti]
MYIDCQGHTAESVRSLAHSLVAAGREGSAEPVALLTFGNVSWSGVTITSAEPERVARVGSRIAREWGIAVEIENTPSVPNPQALQALTGVGFESPLVRHIVASAAWLELPDAPISVWLSAARSLGGVVTLQDLRETVANNPDVLRTKEIQGSTYMSFTNRDVHRTARAEFPLSATEQRTLTLSLIDEWLRSSTREEAHYWSQAAPVHAALSDVLTHYLEVSRFLANVEAYALCQGLHFAYPDGVPAESMAADIHYLEEQGLRDSTHGEWVAFLHHAALCRGKLTFAEDLRRAAGTLPWTTQWARWRLPGTCKPGRPREVEEIRAASAGNGPTVEQWNEQEFADTETYERISWDARTGDLLAGPEFVETDMPGRLPGTPFSDVSYAEQYAAEWRPVLDSVDLPPRMPETVRQAVRVSAADPHAELWAFSGTGGLFVAAVNRAATNELPTIPWADQAPSNSLTKSGTWECPWPVERAVNPAAEWLESGEVFGPGALRPLSDPNTSHHLQHEPTLRFLREFGWPVSRGICGLYSPDLSGPDAALLPVDGTTLLTGLGQHGSHHLLLDGKTGQVFLSADAGTGDNAQLMGSSPGQALFTMLLHHTALCAGITVSDEIYDLADSLKEWLRQSDPAAAESSMWGGEFENLPEAVTDYDMVLAEIRESDAEHGGG